MGEILTIGIRNKSLLVFSSAGDFKTLSAFHISKQFNTIKIK